jgi:glutamyl-tRNA synthetase
VRLAPSPTGQFHWGTARTAIFNWLFARKHGGVFVVRIEDTDRERSEKRFEKDIFEGLRWLALDWDEGPVDYQTLANKAVGPYGPYRQSERTDIHKKYLSQLIEAGKAYYCYCTKEELEAERQGMLTSGLAPKYGGHCRDLTKPPVGREPQVIRFKTPETRVEFKDIIRGTISFDATLFGDFAIAKNVEAPFFHFAGVIDDHLMKISHVIRGEDHISNTPKQILLGRALNLSEPLYAHLPLVLGQNREKLSKRYLSVSLTDYRDKGYLNEAIINFISFLGWHPKNDQEILSPQEIINQFDLRRVQKGGAIFNEERLLWLNAQHIHRLPPEVLEEKLRSFIAPRESINIPSETFHRLTLLEQPRMKTLNDFLESTSFFFKIENYPGALLIPKDQTKENSLEVLRELKMTIEEGPENFDRLMFNSKIEPLLAKWGRGGILWPLRVAVSGKAASPDPLDIIDILGKEETTRRLEAAIIKLNELV